LREPLNPNPAPLKDPVCGIGVTDKSQHRTEQAVDLYYFCSAKCKVKFAADPHRYCASAPSAEAVAALVEGAAGPIYTCPMHPEVQQDHPGNCPKCGMTLEPELPRLVEDDNTPPLWDGVVHFRILSFSSSLQPLIISNVMSIRYRQVRQIYKH
jgi:Cu+-exporting ATPase